MKIILESIEEVNEFIENWKGTCECVSHEKVEVENIDEIILEDVTTYRKHAKSTIGHIPILTDVDEHGNLKLRTQKTKNYTIFDLIELQRKIPQINKFPTWTSLAKAVGLNVNSVMRLSAGIELGFYDFIFNKWNSFPVKYDEFGQLMS